jgi:two-component system, OmpR family, response regulator
MAGAPIKILVVAEPLERDAIRAAAAAAGGVAVGAEAHDDLAQVVSTARADAMVLAGGAGGRDPAATARRLRALAGTRTPIVFVGEPAEVAAVERLVDASFRRPADAAELVSRAIALTVTASAGEASPDASHRAVDQTDQLRAVAASIDQALDAEMLSALRTMTEPRPALAPAPLPPPESAALGGSALLPPPEALDDLWELAGSDMAASSGWRGEGSPASAGALEDVDAPLLLARLFNAGTTGRLVVESAGVERTVYFEAGRPVCATSNSADDRMIAMLVRQGRLTPAQHQTALQAAQESGRKMGALLIDLGVLETGELLPAIRQHYEELVLSLFAWTTGRWRLEAGVMASPAQIRLLRHPAALVREGLRRSYPPERIWDRLGSPRNVFSLDLSGRAADVVGALVSGEERRLPTLFDGVRPLGEVVRLCGLPESEAVVLVFALSAFALLRPTVAAGTPPERDRFAVRDRDIERERLQARYALALEGDYFEVLGVSRRASLEEIRRAYDLVCRDLAPGRVGPELARTMEQELATLREVLEEALRVLATDPLRSRYEAHLPRESERSSARG